MTPTTSTPPRKVEFSDAEKIALCHLRTRYAVGRDELSEIEMIRLRFVRWLYRAGRLSDFT